MKQLTRHHVRKFTTEMRVEGHKKVVFCFSCGPCQINGKSFTTRSGRDKAAEEHAPTK